MSKLPISAFARGQCRLSAVCHQIGRRRAQTIDHQVARQTVQQLAVELLGGVGPLEQLLRYLPEVVDESDDRVASQRVLDLIDVDGALVEVVVEDVHGLFGRRALLPEAEYEVDPLVEVGRHEVALERHAVHAYELLRI